MSRMTIGIVVGLIVIGAGIAVFFQQGQTEVGPCVHQTEGPVLAITEVNDAETGDQISSFTIRDITKPGGYPARSPTNCTGSCGFGRRPGNWSFTVRAAGYQPKPMTVPAQYHTFEGGCPSYASNGTRISVSLAPE